MYVAEELLYVHHLVYIAYNLYQPHSSKDSRWKGKKKRWGCLGWVKVTNNVALFELYSKLEVNNAAIPTKKSLL